MARKTVANEKHDKRTAILKASLEIFSRNGFHKATIRQIAEYADMAVGTIYLYFKSKNEILQEIFRRDIDEHLDALFKKAETMNEVEALRMFFEDRFAHVSKNFKRMALFMHEARCNARLSNLLYKRIHETLILHITKFLNAKIAEGKFRSVNAEEVAILMLSSIITLVMWKEELFPKQYKNKTYKQFTDTISNLLTYGLLTEKSRREN